MPRRRTSRRTALVLVSALTATGLAACGGGDDDPKTLTYWASNQGPNLEADKKILTPELRKFEKRTGIKVKLEVVPWSDLLNRILAAATSGQGPDVLNIGNTWSASLQATGALLPFDGKTLDRIGGRDRFLPSALAAAGAAGKPPAAVPLYSLAYALYYNKKLFREAGIDGPPKTWDELAADGGKLTGDGRYGLALEGGNVSTNVHMSFILGQQLGTDFFGPSGDPEFTAPESVKAVKRFVDLLAKDRIVAKGNAEYAQNQSLRDFAHGKAAMVLWQTAAGTFASYGMKPEEYGVAPLPVRSGSPGPGRRVNSLVAGINLAVFKNTDNRDGALDFVKFMTSDEEQRILNTTYGSVPPVTGAQDDASFAGDPARRVMRDTLAKSAAPLPQVPDESQFETLLGTAVKELFADAAAGRPITEARVEERLSKAQQQMPK